MYQVYSYYCKYLASNYSYARPTYFDFAYKKSIQIMSNEGHL